VQTLYRPIILENVLELAQHPESVSWARFREDVDIHWLYQTDADGPAAALIRFYPGARVALHEHTGFEHILLLAGSQTDDSGEHGRGALLIHPPGTRHEIASAEGCVVLAIYEKPVVFV
jgi:anti-sigma factor ChrR (cupin superfamily)